MYSHLQRSTLGQCFIDANTKTNGNIHTVGSVGKICVLTNHIDYNDRPGNMAGNVELDPAGTVHSALVTASSPSPSSI